MPDLNTSIHLDMLTRAKSERSSPPAVDDLFAKDLYGLEWGDPEYLAPLRFLKYRYVIPYVNENHRAVEIGPGGGRWTRYLLGFERLYIIDYYQQMLDELKRNIDRPNMHLIRNNGTDFPGIEPASIDFVFSFDTFVHLDNDLVEAYLTNIKTIIKPGGNAVIHYSDKTKVLGQRYTGFADNTPENMRCMVTAAGFEILEEDLTTMWHSSLIRFGY